MDLLNYVSVTFEGTNSWVEMKIGKIWKHGFWNLCVNYRIYNIAFKSEIGRLAVNTSMIWSSKHPKLVFRVICRPLKKHVTSKKNFIRVFTYSLGKNIEYFESTICVCVCVCIYYNKQILWKHLAGYFEICLGHA